MKIPFIHLSIFNLSFLINYKYLRFRYFYEFVIILLIIYFLPKVVQLFNLTNHFTNFITQLQFSLYHSLFQSYLLISFQFIKPYLFHSLSLEFSLFEDQRSKNFFFLFNIWIIDFYVPNARTEMLFSNLKYYRIISHYLYLNY